MGTHHIAAYLITLAVGYWVLTLSSKEEKANRTIGQVIAWGIIVVSVCGMLCAAACKMMACHTSMGSCDTTSSYSCPFSGGSKMGACPDMRDMGMPDHKKDASAPAIWQDDKKPAAK